MASRRHHSQAVVVLVVTLTLRLAAAAEAVEFAGGTGEPNDPYQIATAEQLIAIGSDPNLLDKHFVLVADIDLDPNLPGRKVFDKAVIGSATLTVSRVSHFVGTPFTGVFDGRGHTVSNLMINGENCVGFCGLLERGGEVRDMALVNLNIAGSAEVGGLVGCNLGGRVIRSRSGGMVRGNVHVAGLAGYNDGLLTCCHSTGAVTGGFDVGGLAGFNRGDMSRCYSTGPVNGISHIGGLVGSNQGRVAHSYSTGPVIGASYAGGLMGGNIGVVSFSVWDVESSGLARSAAGVGLTTAQMVDPQMLGLNGFAQDPNWVLDIGRDYPRLVWEATPGRIIPEPDMNWLEGGGTAEMPYHIDTVDQLMLLGKASILWDKHFILDADIDLDPNLPGRRVLEQAVIRTFTGVFDGNDHAISHLTIRDAERSLIGEATASMGFLGVLNAGAEVKNLAVADVNIVSSSNFVGGLAGASYGSVVHCSSTGAVGGNEYVGGLLGSASGSVTRCCSTATVKGNYCVGGLAGVNRGVVTESYGAGTVSGDVVTGGLVGKNFDRVAMSHSAGAVSGRSFVGGLVGSNDWAIVTASYSTASVTGTKYIGGLAGYSVSSVVTSYSAGVVTGLEYVGGLTGWGGAINCFWDVETSGQAGSAGGAGKTTAEMRVAGTYLNAQRDFLFGPPAFWDFENTWTICEGKDYPRLRWEQVACGE